MVWESGQSKTHIEEAVVPLLGIFEKPLQRTQRVQENTDATWLFCGMLPWQQNPCHWVGKNASTNFAQYLKANHYDLKASGINANDKNNNDIIKDFVKVRVLCSGVDAVLDAERPGGRES